MNLANCIRNVYKGKRAGYCLKTKVNFPCIFHAFESKCRFSVAEFESERYVQKKITHTYKKKNEKIFPAQTEAIAVEKKYKSKELMLY